MKRSRAFAVSVGNPLSACDWLFEGRVDEVIAKFAKAEDLLAGGLLTFAIFMIGAIVSLVLGGSVPFAISLLLGLAICLPIVIKGLMRVDRLGRLLDPKNTSSDMLLRESGQPAAELLAVRPTDSLVESLPAPNSITEDTTLNLKTPGPKSS